MKSIKRSIYCFLYYGFAKYLPVSYLPGGRAAKAVRAFICRQLFKSCGKNVNIEKGAFFQSGRNISIGDNSDIGINAQLFGETTIGDDVMIGPDVLMGGGEHEFSRTDIPIIHQGFKKKRAYHYL